MKTVDQLSYRTRAMGVLLAVFLPVFLFSVLFTVFVLSYSTRRVFGTRKIDDRTPVKCYTTPYPITEAKIAGDVLLKHA